MIKVYNDGTGREDWIIEQFRVVTWTVNFWTQAIEDRRVAEVEAYSDWTAIDVAVDQFGVCSPDEVKDRNRVWKVINVADEQAEIYSNDPVFADEVFA